MPRVRTLAGAIGAAAVLASLTLTGWATPAGASAGPGLVPLAGSAVPFTSHLTPDGRAAARTRISVQVWLRPRTAAAAQFATAVSTPGSAQFHHYLPPSQYTSRFGASRAEAVKVETWLRGEGFAAVRADAQRSYVRATAPAATISKAFRVQLRLYPATATVNAGPYRLRANDRPVTLPASIAGGVLGITGLDNAAPVTTLTQAGAAVPAPIARPDPAVAHRALCSHYFGQHFATDLPRSFGRSALPTLICGYSAHQLRAAYGASTVSTGQGQTIALVELGLTKQMFRILRTYAAKSGLPAPSAQRYTEQPVGRGSACGDPFDIEEQLDVEAAYDMAPGAHEIVIGGDSCDLGDFGEQGIFDAEIAILDGSGGHPLASVASNSWISGDENEPASVIGIAHAFLMRAAAEGVGMYFSSGDASGVFAPASDPFATAVGGTTVGLGKAGGRLFETGWSTAESLVRHQKWSVTGQEGAAGGGPGALWNEPQYQDGIVPPSMTGPPGDRGGATRSVPDISADADQFTGMAVGLLQTHKHKPPTFGFEGFGGTSLATPLVAGLVAAAQQGQPAPFGFLNPVLYRMVGTGALRDVLPLTASSPSLFRGAVCDDCGQNQLATFDDQSPAMPGYFGQVTAPGYDNMTGLGTPNGQQFTDVLRQLEG